MAKLALWMLLKPVCASVSEATILVGWGGKSQPLGQLGFTFVWVPVDQIDAVEWGLKYLLTGPYLNELQKKSSGRNYKKSALNVLPAPGNCPGLKNCKWFSEDGADDPRHQVAGIWILDMTQAFKNWITVVLVITLPFSFNPLLLCYLP